MSRPCPVPAAPGIYAWYFDARLPLQARVCVQCGWLPGWLSSGVISVEPNVQQVRRRKRKRAAELDRTTRANAFDREGVAL